MLSCHACLRTAVHSNRFSRGSALSLGRCVLLTETRKNCCALITTSPSRFHQLLTDYLHCASLTLPLDVNTSQADLLFSQDNRPTSSLSRVQLPALLLYKMCYLQYGEYVSSLNPAPKLVCSKLHPSSSPHPWPQQPRHNCAWSTHTLPSLQPNLGVQACYMHIDGSGLTQYDVSIPNGFLVFLVAKTLTSPVSPGILAISKTVLHCFVTKLPVKCIVGPGGRCDINVYASSQCRIDATHFTPSSLQSVGMARHLVVICLASILAWTHGQQEQVKLEGELSRAHTCKAGNLSTDWGTATKYLAVSPSNRSMSEQDFFSMTQELICAVDGVITAMRAALEAEALLRQAATDHVLTIMQGVLAACSTLTTFLTIACCCARRGPIWLNALHLPGVAQGLQQPGAPGQDLLELERGLAHLPALPAPAVAQPTREQSRRNQDGVARLAAIHNASHSSPTPPQLHDIQAILCMDRGRVEREVWEWVRGGDAPTFPPPPGQEANNSSISNLTLAPSPSSGRPISILDCPPPPDQAREAAEELVLVPGEADNVTLAAPRGTWYDHGLGLVLANPVNYQPCRTKYSWNCENPWLTDRGYFLPCGYHNKEKEWKQIVGPYQSILAALDTPPDRDCPTNQAYNAAVNFIVAQERNFKERWSRQVNPRLAERDNPDCSPAKRPRLADSTPADESLADRGASGTPAPPMLQGRSLQQVLSDLTGSSSHPCPGEGGQELEQAKPATFSREYMEYVKEEQDSDAPSLTDDEGSDCGDQDLADRTDDRVKTERDKEAVVPDHNEDTAMEIDYAGSEYGPGTAEENRPDIDAINRANLADKQ